MPQFHRKLPSDLRQGSDAQAFPVGGSAGSNSNAFINPLFPQLIAGQLTDTPLTLFIRNPPAIFGSGYVQTVAHEMTFDLLRLRLKARAQAQTQPNTPVTIHLQAKGVDFGQFTTTYIPNTPAKVILSDYSLCMPAQTDPKNIGGVDGFTDNLDQLSGVSCDLVIRPFQWKGVSSGLRHFVRDAMDFHFSMQAFEKVGLCDCDRDGKGTPATKPELTIGQVTAVVSFVAMMRPPMPDPMTPHGSAALGKQIFLGKAAGLNLPPNMCASCHVESFTLKKDPKVYIEWPTNPSSSVPRYIDPDDDSTWPISKAACPQGNPTSATMCPVEAMPPQGTAAMPPLMAAQASAGALVTPIASSQNLSVVKRFGESLQALSPAQRTAFLNATEETALNLIPAPAPPSGLVGRYYVIPLNPNPNQLTNLQLRRLPVNSNGTITVPLFSDLKRHNMGSCLSDPTTFKGQKLPSQSTDVANILNAPAEYLTRPLWGVADTGPWLHDARALTLRDAIILHGDTASNCGSEAAPIIDAFEKLTPAQQQAIVDFLLTLRLPLPYE